MDRVVFHASLAILNAIVAIFCIHRNFDVAAILNLFATVLNLYCAMLFAAKL